LRHWDELHTVNDDFVASLRNLFIFLLRKPLTVYCFIVLRLKFLTSNITIEVEIVEIVEIVQLQVIVKHCRMDKPMKDLAGIDTQNYPEEPRELNTRTWMQPKNGEEHFQDKWGGKICIFLSKVNGLVND